MTKEDYLQHCAAAVLKEGPSRVLISEQGDAVPMGSPFDTQGCVPEVIFIRDDGWSLGVPESLTHVAKKMWGSHWMGVVTLPYTVHTYADWAAGQE